MNNTNHTTPKKQKNTGWIWMLVCCLAPILVIVGLGAAGYNSGGILYTIALLICPIGMIAMMFMGRGSHCAPHDDDVRKPR